MARDLQLCSVFNFVCMSRHHDFSGASCVHKY